MHPKELTSDSLQRRILDNLNVAVILLDDDKALRYINPAGEMLFAVSARQATGTPAKELFLHADMLLQAMDRVLHENQSLTERETKLQIAPTGRELTVDCTITPVANGGRRSLLLEIQPLDRQLRISREESLVAQHEASRAVVRGLAHEIKNPLGGLRGAAQLLEREIDEPHLKEYTQVIIGEADRLQNLLDRLLGPNVRPQKRRVNIHQIIERVRTLATAECPPSVKIIRDYDPSLPDMLADPDQLIQALLNIVRNALQALGASGEVRLRTRARRQFTIGHKRHKLVACIEVVDNGPGIPPEILPQIFYPMVTGRAEGTGLGLSIAQSMVHQHGGLIECDSRPGETRFTLLLPLENSHE